MAVMRRSRRGAEDEAPGLLSLVDARHHGRLQCLRQQLNLETVCLEPKSSLHGGRVLRVRTPAGIAQEVTPR